MRKSLDLISFTIDLIRNNRNLILPTIVGLVIALTVLSEAFILVESSQEGFFNEIVFGSPDKGNSYISDISVELSAFYPEVAEADRFTDFSHYDDRFAKLTIKTMRILDGRIVSLHKAKRIREVVEKDEQLIEREEFIFVDEHGNLRLPEEIRKKTGIKYYIKIEIRDGVACLIPEKKEE